MNYINMVSPLDEASSSEERDYTMYFHEAQRHYTPPRNLSPHRDRPAQHHYHSPSATGVISAEEVKARSQVYSSPAVSSIRRRRVAEEQEVQDHPVTTDISYQHLMSPTPPFSDGRQVQQYAHTPAGSNMSKVLPSASKSVATTPPFSQQRREMRTVMMAPMPSPPSSQKMNENENQAGSADFFSPLSNSRDAVVEVTPSQELFLQNEIDGEGGHSANTDNKTTTSLRQPYHHQLGGEFTPRSTSVSLAKVTPHLRYQSEQEYFLTTQYQPKLQLHEEMQGQHVIQNTSPQTTHQQSSAVHMSTASQQFRQPQEHRIMVAPPTHYPAVAPQEGEQEMMEVAEPLQLQLHPPPIPSETQRGPPSSSVPYSSMVNKVATESGVNVSQQYASAQEEEMEKSELELLRSALQEAAASIQSQEEKIKVKEEEILQREKELKLTKKTLENKEDELKRRQMQMDAEVAKAVSQALSSYQEREDSTLSPTAKALLRVVSTAQAGAAMKANTGESAPTGAQAILDEEAQHQLRSIHKELLQREEEITESLLVLEKEKAVLVKREVIIAAKEKELVEAEESLLNDTQRHGEKISEMKKNLDDREKSVKLNETNLQRKVAEIEEKFSSHEKKVRAMDLREQQLQTRERDILHILSFSTKLEEQALYVNQSANRMKTREESLWDAAASGKSSHALLMGDESAGKAFTLMKNDLMSMRSQLQNIGRVVKSQ